MALSSISQTTYAYLSNSVEVIVFELIVWKTDLDNKEPKAHFRLYLKDMRPCDFVPEMVRKFLSKFSFSLKVIARA